ncbi:MAG: hypothetical protein KAI47_12250 [Deltaproteobacteria bacterium]|nr:hypothetical protein [Deltaproteobacteria bacterium]
MIFLAAILTSANLGPMTHRFESISTKKPLPNDDALRDECVLVDLNPAPDRPTLDACVTKILVTVGERFA